MITTAQPKLVVTEARTALDSTPPLKEFKVGTTGWTVSDLDDERIETLWAEGNYEIISGVLTQMPPAYFDPQARLTRILQELMFFTRSRKIAGDFGPECDIVIDDDRVLVADLVWMAAADVVRLRQAAREAGRAPERARILVPPTLVLESVSYGHERHDRVTKFKWYAEFGVMHYWIFDALKRTLDCYVLAGGEYRLAASGEGDQPVAVPLFEGLTIDLAPIWRD